MQGTEREHIETLTQSASRNKDKSDNDDDKRLEHVERLHKFRVEIKAKIAQAHIEKPLQTKVHTASEEKKLFCYDGH